MFTKPSEKFQKIFYEYVGHEIIDYILLNFGYKI